VSGSGSPGSSRLARRRHRRWPAARSRVGSMPSVNGKSRAIAIEGPIPGRAPPRMP
jgi:hypothetical protein